MFRSKGTIIKPNMKTQCVHSLNVKVLWFVWTETCRRIFNIDHYIYCCVTVWNKLLYSTILLDWARKLKIATGVAVHGYVPSSLTTLVQAIVTTAMLVPSRGKQDTHQRPRHNSSVPPWPVFDRPKTVLILAKATTGIGMSIIRLSSQIYS